VRVFEWNGSMLHAKTAVADGRWARVGSTNLNVASWLGNCELDVVAEDATFARHMEAMYLEDLTNATEVVLDQRRAAPPPRWRHRRRAVRGGGSTSRAAAGLLRIGNTVGAAVTNRRVLEPVEVRIMLTVALVLLILAVGVALFPRVLAYPIAAVAGWFAAALFYRALRLRRQGPQQPPPTE
jgi:cardiolipin synthase A/B